MLVLEPHAEVAKLVPEPAVGERSHLRAELLHGAVDLGFACAWSEHLESVIAHVSKRVDPDESARLECSPPADARDQRVPSLESAKQRARWLGHRRILGPWRDRGERA